MISYPFSGIITRFPLLYYWKGTKIVKINLENNEILTTEVVFPKIQDNVRRDHPGRASSIQPIEAAFYFGNKIFVWTLYGKLAILDANRLTIRTLVNDPDFPIPFSDIDIDAHWDDIYPFQVRRISFSYPYATVYGRTMIIEDISGRYYQGFFSLINLDNLSITHITKMPYYYFSNSVIDEYSKEALGLLKHGTGSPSFQPAFSIIKMDLRSGAYNGRILIKDDVSLVGLDNQYYYFSKIKDGKYILQQRNKDNGELENVFIENYSRETKVFIGKEYVYVLINKKLLIFRKDRRLVSEILL